MQRRTIIAILPIAAVVPGAALAQSAPAAAPKKAEPKKADAKAAGPAMLDEKSPQAVALGYVADTTKADKKKYTKWSKDQKCSNCALYQAKATDKQGPCPLFAGQNVAGAGWCSAWAKKA